ncbi:Hypothetical protein CM240_3130 [Clostridium bornimense]|uniref:2-isopropylmalate synthase/homocitrate synthase post-catalytic domain-containing protein n=1 Tax=Clostridium bornimense TaxID=1216932 RepID=W6S760_9CLOT|nr:hypothetical protein [Clostridium bornimense]CDM70247.1 Hypothetical protein CM240_3130 [Clostridium bornimense]
MNDVKIIDRTIVELYYKNKGKLLQNIDEIVALLIESGVDIVEVPKEIAENVVYGNKFIYRKEEEEVLIDSCKDIECHSIFNKEVNRIIGLGDMLFYDYENILNQIFTEFGANVELSIKNDFHMATSILNYWVSRFKGKKVVTSFSGIGGFAPTEEILASQRYLYNLRKSGDFKAFKNLREIVEDITEMKMPRNKPIIGEEIFYVESGIHVDGIYKDPSNYEPFLPEDIGAVRKIVLGKSSGRKAIEIKLKEMNVVYDDKTVIKLLDIVKKKSIDLKRGLSDDEFKEIVKEKVSDNGK